MEHLQEMPLQATEKAVDQLWVIEMERILTLVPFEEIPVLKGPAYGTKAAMKLHQLFCRVG